jgi:calcium uniporter protein, mitochondrial
MAPNTRAQQRSSSASSADARARDLHEKATADEMAEFDGELEHHKERQKYRPWHREGADQPPVRRQRSAGAMTKGEHASTASWARC